MKLLELFSGTGSVGKVAKNFGIDVVSLDKDIDADIKTDIMDWDYKVHPPHYFHILCSVFFYSCLLLLSLL